jgi:biotin--protein ligase
MGIPKAVVGTSDEINKGEREADHDHATTSSSFSPPPSTLTSSSTGETIQLLDAGRDEAKAHLPEFNLDVFERHLSSAMEQATAKEEWHVLAGRRLSSTQKVLEENASSLPGNSIIISDTQTQGKGRAGNKWISPPGCLMCSIYCKLEIEGHKLPLLQYATTLAVVQALDTLVGSDGSSEKDEEEDKKFARIKWPNDIYIDKTKVGGVLCQSVYKGKGTFQLISGLGINMDNEEPTFCVNQVLRNANKQPVSKEHLLALVLPRLMQAYKVICEDSFNPLHEEYYRFWLHSGQRLVVKGDAEAKTSVREKNVVVTGLTDDGFLLAKDEVGDVVELYPDGNSLDLMLGLIYRKTTKK